MKSNTNHPKTDEALARLRNKFCEVHITPIGETQFTIKSDSAHHTKLLFNRVADELNTAYENE